MSGRRTSNNRIRGPQSALTDFLASNNISAAQISADYERRRRDAQQQAEQEAAANGTIAEEEEQLPEEREETALQKKKRKRAEEKALAKIKEGKSSKKQKKGKKGDPEGEDSDDAFGMYTKSKPLPGQLENCEKCEKRFTVTPYSKTGPDGGLLCVKCSKEQTDQKKKEDKIKKQAAPRVRQRQKQSDLLDGIVGDGAVSLQDLCIKTIADNIHDVEEFGDLPQNLLKRLSEIFSKRRVVTSRTLDLFFRPNAETMDITDCGKLEVGDYIKIFSFAPQIKAVNLQQAGQFKDEVMDYIMERDVPIQNLKLYAANLITNDKWIEFFTKCGHRLESLQLKWLNCALDDEAFLQFVQHCPNLKRLKLKQCWQLGDAAVAAIPRLQNLEHLSLHLKEPASAENLVAMITAVGPNLRTLSLEDFYNADDSVLEAIHTHCRKLEKLRFTGNDVCTDAGYTNLFTNWSNPPLTFVDLSSTRSIDYDNPDGTEDAIVGLATSGFGALMSHSGSSLKTLVIASCRHIGQEGLSSVWDGKKEYPCLRKMDVSFVKKMDTPVVAGIFKSCPQLTNLAAFGCFSISDVLVPKGVALIGVPNAQDSIIQEGGYDFDMIKASVGFGVVYGG
ncbi:MAG: hypothetical protein LQ338_000190 [Usnochroma carphineum]|nr:MAG: hypothetical protein LQ338_000190 [Usnochroma carphineum]